MAPQRIAAFLIAISCSACAALNPFRLDDQVALFHDDLRWNRLAAAESSIDSHIRDDFARRHRSWGRVVHIVDVEVEGTRVSGFTGTAVAHFTWTRAYESDLRDTVVETRWKAGLDGSWHCDDEHVVSGDPSLLASAR